MDDNSGKSFLTAAEISKFLRIPLNTIYRLTKKGVLHGVKVGKQWRYNKDDLEKYLAGQIDSRNLHLEKFAERRGYPRMNCNFRCKSKINVMGQEELVLTNGYISNISGSGIFMHNNNGSLKQLNIGDPIDIDFNLVSDIDGTVHSIHVKGRIVRRTYSGVGVKFRHIDDEYKNLITDFVD